MDRHGAPGVGDVRSGGLHAAPDRQGPARRARRGAGASGDGAARGEPGEAHRGASAGN